MWRKVANKCTHSVIWLIMNFVEFTLKHSYACISELLKYEWSNFEVVMRISIQRDMLVTKACLGSREQE